MSSLSLVGVPTEIVRTLELLVWAVGMHHME
jgi:hypothetical protein